MADITKYTFESGTSAFTDFEPYYCGTPAITEGFLDFETDETKCNSTNNFQGFVRNGFTAETQAIDPTDNTHFFKVGNKVITGCKKGTIVVANRPGNNQSALLVGGSKDAEIKLTDKDGKKCLKISIFWKILGAVIWTDIKEFDEDWFAERGLVFPERLGILLVGGGGGAGGGTWYDANKNGKSEDQYYCPGGSGGGGGSIWGVIFLDNDHKVYTIDTGYAGSGGTNATRDGLTHNKPKVGGDGGKGGNTSLIFGNTTVATAYGGSGGGHGHWDWPAGGGGGGSASYAGNLSYFTYCGSHNGHAGIACSKSETGNITMPAETWSVQFFEDKSPNGSFSDKINNGELSGTVSASTNARLPGGHSYGSGASNDNEAGYGGGGCAQANSDGGNAYWAIFY